ncbi:MAG: hypothetical protein ACM3ZF_05320 [Mycobacterium leprae]
MTLILGIAGFVIARNINRDVRLRMAERRLTAYERLWALMRPASRFSSPLDEAGRRCLHEKFTDWYYANGDGMLLERTSRTVYLEVKDNLVRPLQDITPQRSRDRLQAMPPACVDRERGKLSQRQLSLLRTQLKSDLRIYARQSDLAVYGTPYAPHGSEDSTFLEYCGVNVKRRPWSKASA